jgi:hypothetical protein
MVVDSGTRGGCLNEFNSRSELSQVPAAEIAKRILSQIPTRFGRLLFLCSLRDASTGRYNHPVIQDRIGTQAADRTLAHQHHQIFAQWLRLNLADQKADLDEYLHDSGMRPADLPYRDLTPATAHEVEKQLYLADLEVLLQLISFEAAAPAADASRRR